MPPLSWTINALLREGTARLADAGIEDADLDARLLLQFVTALSRSQLVMQGREELDGDDVDQFMQLIGRRCRRVPLQHLTGTQDFWSLELVVSPAVLIPRPETEFLLEQVLATVHRRPGQLMLDMCTGSGAIALVLARELSCRVVAVDLSKDGLSIASLNCDKYRLGDQVSFVQSDLFAGLLPGRVYDCIVSNPPYIAEGEIDLLEPEVALGEPRMALSGGESGLTCIEQIIRSAPAFLRTEGWLFMEIGAEQKAAVETLLHETGVYERIEVLADYAGRPRVARARLAGACSPNIPTR